MAIETLLGRATDEQLKKLPGRVRNPDRVKQNLDAFALHLQGVSYRGIQEHFGWKSLSSAENSVKRGEILAKNLNLDSEKIRLKLALFFEEICDITLAQIRDQQKDGQITQVANSDGTTVVTRRRGVDTRLLGEAGRGAIRFAQFAGLMDADKSTSGGGDVSTNVVFVSPQTDLSEWETKTVDVTPSGPVSGPKIDTSPNNPIDSKDDLLLLKQITGKPELEKPDQSGALRVVQREIF